MFAKHEHGMTCTILALFESKPEQDFLELFKANMLWVLSELCKCLCLFAHSVITDSTIFGITPQLLPHHLFHRLIHIQHPIAIRGIGKVACKTANSCASHVWLCYLDDKLLRPVDIADQAGVRRPEQRHPARKRKHPRLGRQF